MKTRFLFTAVVLASTGTHALAETGANPASAPAAPGHATVPAPVKVVPALETAQAHSSTVKPKPVVKRAASPVVPVRARIDAVEPKTDATMERAVNQSKDWLTAENRPAGGDDGRVVFTYGAGLPVVVCAPLKICVIELQPGERVNKEVHLGDSVRWIVTPAESGSGKNAQTLLVIKPKEVGLDTNMLIPTDRRNYYIRLASRSSDYLARVAFNYPEEAKAEWEAYAARRAELDKSEGAPEMPVLSVERLNFDYGIEGDASFKPIRVLDNGEKTYIQLPATAKAEEIPVLVVLNSDGKEQLVNNRFINGWYEVDRLFERAALILGVGKEQKKVVITNNARYKQRSRWPFGWDR